MKFEFFRYLCFRDLSRANEAKLRENQAAETKKPCEKAIIIGGGSQASGIEMPNESTNDLG